MQENKPIAFASKSLSKSEQIYDNIEREIIAIVFSCDRFHLYVYGTKFTVMTIEMIKCKSKPKSPAAPHTVLQLLGYIQTC